MKIIKILCVLLLCIFVFCACGKKEADKETQEIDIVEKEFEPIVTESISDYEEELLDLENYSAINQYDVDATTSFYWFKVAGSENGYYFREDFGDTVMMFMDRKSEQIVPLCNKADCAHDDKACNAYYSCGISIMSDEVSYDLSYLQFYDGYLYTLGYKIGGSLSLYRISEDGSTREKYMELYKMDFSSLSQTSSFNYISPKVCIHRGYVYYIIPHQEVPELRRIKLGGEEIETVFELNGERATIYRMKPYGDYIFFQAGNFRDDTYCEIDAGVFAYNLNTGKVQLLKKEAINAYSVVDNILYCSMLNGIMKCDLTDGKSSILIETNTRCNFSADKQYIYVEDEEDKSILHIYNLNGELVCDVKGNIYDNYFGDEEYLFASGYIAGEDNNIRVMNMLKISDIAKGNAEWQVYESKYTK